MGKENYMVVNMDQTYRSVRKTDYLVVGAGAAGCTFGFLMKRAGADVLLLEMQDAEKREKLCAGILENRAEEAFCNIFGATVDEAGLSPMRVENLCLRNGTHEYRRAMLVRKPSDVTGSATFRLEKSQASSVRNYLRAGGKALAKKVLKEALGYDLGKDFTYRVLPRKRIDNYIRDRFLAEGGQIFHHTIICSVSVSKGMAECIDLHTKQSFTVRFRYIVGADGAMSSVRRLFGKRQQRAALAIEAVVPLVRRETVISFVPGFQGYCWYAPRGEDATIGCGFHNLGDNQFEICKKRLTAFCEDMGIAIPSRLRGAFLPAGGEALLQPEKNAFLLGDAAGLNDAFTGGGIHYAMLSAQALAAYFTEGVPYEDAMKHHVAFVRKNAEHVKEYCALACTVISNFGKKT